MPIIQVECARQRLPAVGPATKALTNLDNPSLDWVSLAHGMGVSASRASTADQLVQQLEAALKMTGPYLISAELA